MLFVFLWGGWYPQRTLLLSISIFNRRFESNSIGTFIAHWNTGRNWTIKLYGKNFLVEINFGNDIDVLIFTDAEYYKINTRQIDKKFKPSLYMQKKNFYRFDN